MTTRIYFWQSEPHREAFPDGPETITIDVVHGDVQLTYDQLRVCRDEPDLQLREGDPIAYISRDGWHTFEPLPLGIFSDVVISVEDEG